MALEDRVTAELFGGPKDGDTLPLSLVPPTLTFPRPEAPPLVYRFQAQTGPRSVRYEWAP